MNILALVADISILVVAIDVAFLIFKVQSKQSAKATEDIIKRTCKEFSALRGGTRSLESIGEEQDAELDAARGKYTKTMTGGEDDLYGESSDTEFCLQEFRVDLHNLAEGDTIIFRVYTTEDGTERQISSDLANTFTGPQDPARVEIIGSANQVWGREDISITAEQTDGTNREIVCYWRDAKRGG